MSLLEDIFLEDEAGEAQELERVIEGDDFEDRPRSAASNSDDNSEKEDEAAEDKRRVDPTKAKTTRVVKNPRVILNPARLTGPRGIQMIPDHFKAFKFKGKGHEKEDLDLVLKKLEHWAYRLFPKFEFGDCLKKIDTLGKKRPVMVHLQKIRSDQSTTEETVVQRDSSDDEAPADQPQEEDEFDKLLQQQIELARATPAPGSVTKRGFDTPSVDKRSPFTMPKATSSPSISDEQGDRMIRNRQLAEERTLAKLKQNSSTSTSSTVDLTNLDAGKSNGIKVIVKQQNKSNVTDSSDDEDSNTVTQPVTVDVQLHVTADKDMKEVNNKSAYKNTNVSDGDETVKKHDMSNVIDSSDGDYEDSNKLNQPVKFDIQMRGTAVENMTEVYNDTADKNTNVIDRKELNGDKKYNKSNLIDSSDTENPYIVNQPVTVDVQMHEKVVKDMTEVNNGKADKNINVISGEVINVIRDNSVTVDLTEEIPIKHSSVFKEGQVIYIENDDSDDIRIRRPNKSKDVDSSGDECEMTSFNQSVSVDVHSHHHHHHISSYTSPPRGSSLP